MSTQILATKLYVPISGSKLVSRPELIEALNVGLHRKLTLISAPAGFGKTTVVSQWLSECDRPVAWLSLDESDSDSTRFLAYFVAAIQTISPQVGTSIMAMLQSQQTIPIESMLTTLLNEITEACDNFILVLDDLHLIESLSVDNVLNFLMKNLPPQLHLVITTREDPNLPLARLRARNQLTELRVADLRFSTSETANFLSQMLDITITEENIEALNARTEGWIVGLQLAAISMQEQRDVSKFIESFTGSHHFVLDYLMEEVIQQQPQDVQNFLLHTSILDRISGSLCDAVLQDNANRGQHTLEYIQHANLFLIPLDNQRQWYRYHHLFADLLRQRLDQHPEFSAHISELHIRASQWYEDNGFEIEAFQHATKANDFDRAERLLKGNGLPLLYRGILNPILNWLESLPESVLNAKPSLWIWSALASTYNGFSSGIEEKLFSAEKALEGYDLSDVETRDLIGQIASMRAMLAVPRNLSDTIITESKRALEYLHPDNIHVRMSATWTLGYAYQTQGDRVAARQAYIDAIAMSEITNNIMNGLAAHTCLGQVEESNNKLYRAEQIYRKVIELAKQTPPSYACEAYLGLARLHYQWNKLEEARTLVEKSIKLGQQMQNVDTPASGWMLLSRINLVQGDISSALNILDTVDQFIQQNNFLHHTPEVAGLRSRIALHQGDISLSTQLLTEHDLPLSHAQLFLAQGDSSQALAVLEPFCEQMKIKNWADEQLKVMVLQAVAHHMQGEIETAIQVVSDTLTMAEPHDIVRVFVDAGQPMNELLSEALTRGIKSDYVHKLLDAFNDKPHQTQNVSPQPLIDPLSERELEVLVLVAEGLSNREISDRLFLALSTVKGHNRIIFEKLQVQRRTEAVARARELGLL